MVKDGLEEERIIKNIRVSRGLHQPLHLGSGPNNNNNKNPNDCKPVIVPLYLTSFIFEFHLKRLLEQT